MEKKMTKAELREILLKLNYICIAPPAGNLFQLFGFKDITVFIDSDEKEFYIDVPNSIANSRIKYKLISKYNGYKILYDVKSRVETFFACLNNKTNLLYLEALND